MQTQFEREELQAPLSEINMTPLVDVMLVLLVIFLVKAPVINSAINLNLPQEAASEITEEKIVAISINKDGQYFINDRAISFDELSNELSAIAKNNPKQHIHLRADADVAYSKVSHVLAAVQKMGLTNIGFITEPNN